MLRQKLKIKRTDTSTSSVRRTYYNLDLLNYDFGMLYIDSECLSLSWRGGIEFAKANEEILFDLPRMLGREPAEAKNIVVQWTAADSKLRRNASTLNSPPHVFGLTDIGPATTFARFDIEESRSWSFSVTLDNPRSIEAPEIGVKLNRLISDIPTLKGLVDWSLKHHSASPDVKRTIDSEFVARQFALLLEQ